MAVCTQCGASTSATMCPRCGGQTSPYAAPKPEAERGPAVTPPAQTTVLLPRVEVPGFAGSPLPQPRATVPAGAANQQAPSAPAAWPPAATSPRLASAPQVVTHSGATAPVATSGPLTGRSGAILAGAIVVLLALGAVLWWLMHRTNGIETVVRPAVTQAVVSLPPGSAACAVDDAPETGRQVFVGNAATTCAFAQNVKAALGSRSGSVTLDAYSPKAGRSYSMTCVGDPNVTCSGGNGAVVYLVPPTAKAVIRAS